MLIMQTPQDIITLENRLRESGFSVASVCRRADMAESTWWRWKHGRSAPTPRMWGRVEAAIAEITGGDR